MQQQPTEEYNEAVQYSKLSNIFLDCEFLSDPKVLGLLDQWSDRGLTALLAIYSALAKERGASLPKKLAISVLVKQLAWARDDAESYTASIIELGLIDGNDNHISHERIRQEQLATARRQKRWRDQKCSGEYSVQNTQRSPIRIPIQIPRGIHAEAIEDSPEFLNKEQRTKNKESNIKENGVMPVGLPPGPKRPEVTPQTPEEPPDKYILEAEKHLMSPTGEELWEQGNSYILMGKRPLRKYPELKLTPMELAEVLRQYELAGIAHKLKDAFRAARGRLAGKDPERAAVFNWLVGFIKQEILESTIKETRLAKVKGD